MPAPDERPPPRIAVAGNPNTGKTSLLNSLTGMGQSVANYPGVTVEIKTGTAEHGGRKYQIVDLPGTYSLTAYSGEELVARNFVIEERPEVVVDVVDASNLERNLYLTVQLLEMRAPLVIALNMVDVARARGVEINAKRLGELLGVPVVPTVASRGQGLDELMAACAEVADRVEDPEPARVTYGHMVEGEVAGLARLIAADQKLAGRYHPRWLAVKLLEKDTDVLARVREFSAESDVLEKAVADSARRIEAHFDEDAATIIAERRYGFAAGAIKDCVKLSGQARQNATDKIDAVVCNRYLGPAILAGVVYGLFLVVFTIADGPWLFGKSMVGWTETFFEWLAAQLAPLAESAPMLHSLLADGVIGGVGGVVGFVPLIFVMFFFVAILEDSGYIARVAFIMDRPLKAFGLQGKSILAMIVSGGLGGGGCAVPGVMATRTLREEKDRLITILVAPLMNCGAKLPVFLMLVAAFFAEHKARMLFLLWGLSWCFALGAAWMLRKFVVRGKQTPFVMELPPYHRPTLRGVLRHTWERTWMYLKKAGTILLAVNIVLWALMYFPRLDEKTVAEFDEKAAVAAGEAERERALAAKRDAELVASAAGAERERILAAKESAELAADAAEAQRDAIIGEKKKTALVGSVAGRAGGALEAVTKPTMGFTWRENVALIGGFAAKEVVVGALGTAYSLGDVDPENPERLSERLREEARTTKTWNPLRAFTLMIFVMIYAPCVATLVVIRRETGTWKWAAFATLYTTTLAFTIATIIFQVGKLMGWGLYT